jgi:hypothetical protein
VDKRRSMTCVILAALVPIGAMVAGESSRPKESLELLPIDAETNLALSAAPEHLRRGAGVVALTEKGFVTVRESKNGFTCVVNRDHPLSVKPTCYDAEGTATILPKVIFVGNLIVEGVGLDEIERRVAAKFESGEFIAPRRPGIAYMLSCETRNFNPGTGGADPFPPHLMFYAPNLSNEDIGTTPSAEAHARHPWLPFVGYEGPHGFIIVVVDESCKGR